MILNQMYNCGFKSIETKYTFHNKAKQQVESLKKWYQNVTC